MRLLLSLLLACTPTGSDTDPSDTETTDTEAVEEVPYDELAEPSGACPDLSGSDTVTFESSGEEREVTVVIPEDVQPDAPVVFFFHGLSSPDQTPNPGDYMARALDLQDVADEEGIIFILPVSPIQTIGTLEFFMWDLEEDLPEDLVLFDDLRTCIDQEHDVDLTRLHSVGFSGGALFTTRVLSQRSGTLASALEFSGGVDLEIPTFDDLIPSYSTPTNTELPVALWSGGDSDVWPSESWAIVVFEDATDDLQDYLVADGHEVVRCGHDEGHTIPVDAWDFGLDWLLTHQMGEPSTFSAGTYDEWCAEAQ